MCGFLSRGNRLEYCAGLSDFILGECIWGEIQKPFKGVNINKIGPISQSVFGIQPKICLPKLKSECAAQYSSLLPLDKYPHMPTLKIVELFKRNDGKIIVTYEPII